MKRVLSTLILSIFIASAVSAAVLYVDNNVNDGKWEKSYDRLELALLDAKSGDQIWVAAGTYYPTEGTDRTSAFIIKEGVKIYGGFIGGEKSLSKRDHEKNSTVLSGDIGNLGYPMDNVYHVLENNTSLSEKTILDGLVVTGGYADESSNKSGRGCGAGLYLENDASPTVVNCKFTLNIARGDYEYGSGGAVALFKNSNPRFTNTIFAGNDAIWGGAVSGNENSDPVFEYCVFTANSADFGGAYEGWRDNPSFAHSRFLGNRSLVYGGAAAFHGGESSIDNCLFEGNQIYGEESNIDYYGLGGALAYLPDPFGGSHHSNGTLKNSTFHSNTSADGSAVSSAGSGQAIEMDKNVYWKNGFTKSIPVEGAEIKMPFEQPGEGEHYFVSHGDVYELNSWNMDVLEVNGVDVTNKMINTWSGNIPPRVNDKYYIKYKSSVAWSKLVVNGRSFAPITIPNYKPRAVEVELPFSFDGKGKHQWVVSGEIVSFETSDAPTFKINGKTLKNKHYSTEDLPDRINGKYYIEFKGNKKWSHVELNGTSFPYVEEDTPLGESEEFLLNPVIAYETASASVYNSLFDAGEDKSYEVPENIESVNINYRALPSEETPYTDTENLVIDEDADQLADVGWMPMTYVPEPVVEEIIDINLFFEGYVVNGDGTFTAYFGYENNSTLDGQELDVTLTAGSGNNYFSNGIYNEYLPNTFVYPYTVDGQPGRTDYFPSSAIVIPNWDGGELVWTVNGTSVSVSLLPEYDKSPLIDISPIYEGWMLNENGTYTAYFGYETASTFADEPYTAVLAKGSDSNKLSSDDNSVLPDTFAYSNIIEGRPGRTDWWPETAFEISGWNGDDIVWTLNGKTATATLDASLQHFEVDEGILVVDNNSEDGEWNSAQYRVFETLEGALAVAEPGYEIWIAAGTYKPTDGTDRKSVYELVEGISILGGFIGGESHASERNAGLNEVILSGDIGVENDMSDNCYHVVRYDGVMDTNTVLDGLTIIAGNANRDSNSNNDAYGGGLLLEDEASPKISNVIFIGNITGGSYKYNSGGAVALYGQCDPVFESCVFDGNSSMWGGGISSNDGAFPTYIDCKFINNTGQYGGAYETWRDDASFKNCEFRNNTATLYGGAAALHSGSYTIKNCLFEANTADGQGGAIAVVKDPFGSGSTVLNSLHNTFTNNSAPTGSALYVSVYGEAYVDSAMFWGNVDSEGTANAIASDVSKKSRKSSEAIISITNSAFDTNEGIPDDMEEENLLFYTISEDDPFSDDEYYVINHAGTGIPEYGWLPDGLEISPIKAPLLKLKVFLQGGF